MHTHILLVDDDPIQRDVRRAVLARAGNTIIAASGGEEALRLLEDESFRQNLGLLITDHLMPGMNGPDLVRRARQIMPELPVLVLSGLPDAEAEYAATPVSFRLKPFSPNELIRLTQQLLRVEFLRSA